MRCDVVETSGHVTAKSSICAWAAFYKSGVYARKVQCLTLGGLSCVEGSTDVREIECDLKAEVSRRHSRPNSCGRRPEQIVESTHCGSDFK